MIGKAQVLTTRNNPKLAGVSKARKGVVDPMTSISMFQMSQNNLDNTLSMLSKRSTKDW